MPLVFVYGTLAQREALARQRRSVYYPQRVALAVANAGGAPA